MYYLTDILADRTDKKSIQDAYERNNLTVIVTSDHKFWYFGKCNIEKLGITVRKEMKRLFPELTYIYDEYKSV